MLRKDGKLQTHDVNGATVYTCGYRECVTRAQVSFEVYDGTGQSSTVTLDVVLGGLEVGMSQARKKIARAITEYKEAELAREISARQDGFFNSFQKPPIPRHKKAPDYMARSWLRR